MIAPLPLRRLAAIAAAGATLAIAASAAASTGDLVPATETPLAILLEPAPLRAGRSLLPIDDLPAAPRSRVCPRPAVTMVRWGAESDSFRLFDCEGAIDPDAIERLTLMARPPAVPRPDLPLPEEADEESVAAGEWLPSIRIVAPRLAWLVQRIADAFPRRSMYIVSGYRPGEHQGLHGTASALDLHVLGVRNEDLYRFCRRLDDVGCGLYPNSTFVHVDVRPPGTGRAYWVDVSGPGEPARYVDGWPGVEERGAATWLGGRGGEAGR